MNINPIFQGYIKGVTVISAFWKTIKATFINSTDETTQYEPTQGYEHFGRKMITIPVVAAKNNPLNLK